MSINLSSLLSSTAMGTVRIRRFYNVSSTFIASTDCTVRMTVFGGSASGGVARNTAGAAYATGGGAGAKAVKTVRLKAGQQLVMNIGAAGAANTPTQAGSTAFGANGNDGGDTTVTSSPAGIANVTAGGGKAGKFAITHVNVDGGLGGIATGGDVNVKGGRGGNIVAGDTGNKQRATGGGALPLIGGQDGYRGGDILTNVSKGATVATGGAGVGGNGGDIGLDADYAASGGGGSGNGALPVISTATFNASGAAILGLRHTNSAAVPQGTDYPLNDWMPYSGAGSAGVTGGNTQRDAAPGGGSGGYAYQNATGGSSPKPGSFAGGGGCVTYGPTTSQVGVNTLYGGTGGAATASSNAVTAGNILAAAAGGKGLVVLEIF